MSSKRGYSRALAPTTSEDGVARIDTFINVRFSLGEIVNIIERHLYTVITEAGIDVINRHSQTDVAMSQFLNHFKYYSTAETILDVCTEWVVLFGMSCMEPAKDVKLRADIRKRVRLHLITKVDVMFPGLREKSEVERIAVAKNYTRRIDNLLKDLIPDVNEHRASLDRASENFSKLSNSLKGDKNVT